MSISGKIADCRLGVRGRVWVDGLERNYVTRCKIGVNGWAEVMIRDSQNRPVVKNHRLKTRVVTGTVHFEPAYPLMREMLERNAIADG